MKVEPTIKEEPEANFEIVLEPVEGEYETHETASKWLIETPFQENSGGEFSLESQYSEEILKVRECHWLPGDFSIKSKNNSFCSRHLLMFTSLR